MPIPITTLSPDDDVSLPFELSALNDWAKSKDSTIKESKIYFDVDLVKIVIDHSGNFINDFLSKNMVFNTDFRSNLVVSNVTQKPSKATLTMGDRYTTSTENGKTVYKLKSGLASDGGNITIYGESGNQRVAVREGCNKKHLYYPEGCTVVNVNEGEYYQCNCNGSLAMNSSKSGVHTHCSEFTNDIADPVLAYNSSLSASAGLQMAKYQTGKVDKFGNIIKITPNGIRFSKTPTGYYRTTELENGENKPYDGNTGDLTDPSLPSDTTPVSYQNRDNLINDNLELRTLIYYYYISLSENYNLNNNISSADSSTTGSIALQDSNVKYRTEYLNAFNLFSGIIIISGYIYTNFRNV